MNPTVTGLGSIASGSDGLTSDAVAARRAAGRVNGRPAPVGRGVGQIIRSNLLTRFNVLLGTLLVATVAVGAIKDSVFIWVVVVNLAVGVAQELQARRTLDQLTVVATAPVRVRRDATLITVAPADIVEDDLVVVGLVLALATGIARLPFPLLPRQLSLVGAFTIGVPAFFLALEPNTARARPGFARRVLATAIPAGTVTAAATFAAYADASNDGATLTQARTTATIVLAVVAGCLLALIARPSNLRRLALLLTLVALFHGPARPVQPALLRARRTTRPDLGHQRRPHDRRLRRPRRRPPGRIALRQVRDPVDRPSRQAAERRARRQRSQGSSRRFRSGHARGVSGPWGVAMAGVLRQPTCLYRKGPVTAMH